MVRSGFTCYICKNYAKCCSLCPLCEDFGLCSVCKMKKLMERLSNVEKNVLKLEHLAAAKLPQSVPFCPRINVLPLGQPSSTQAIASSEKYEIENAVKVSDAIDGKPTAAGNQQTEISPASERSALSSLDANDDDDENSWITISSPETTDDSDDGESNNPNESDRENSFDSSGDSNPVDVFNKTSEKSEGCIEDGKSSNSVDVLNKGLIVADKNFGRASENEIDPNGHASIAKITSTGAIRKQTVFVEDNGSGAEPQNRTQDEKDRELQMALSFLAGVGFSNNNGWLSTLLKTVHCDVARALDIMQPKRNRQAP